MLQEQEINFFFLSCVLLSPHFLLAPFPRRPVNSLVAPIAPPCTPPFFFFDVFAFTASGCSLIPSGHNRESGAMKKKHFHMCKLGTPFRAPSPYTQTQAAAKPCALPARAANSDNFCLPYVSFYYSYVYITTMTRRKIVIITPTKKKEGNLCQGSSSSSFLGIHVLLWICCKNEFPLLGPGPTLPLCFRRNGSVVFVFSC